MHQKVCTLRMEVEGLCRYFSSIQFYSQSMLGGSQNYKPVTKQIEHKEGNNHSDRTHNTPESSDDVLNFNHLSQTI